jgi:hypothetical protein
MSRTYIVRFIETTEWMARVAAASPLAAIEDAQERWTLAGSDGFAPINLDVVADGTDDWQAEEVRNTIRATWAQVALATFTSHAFFDRTPEDLHSDDLQDAIADLIGDPGHYVDRRFKKRVSFPDLVARGLGMWSAERACRNGELKRRLPQRSKRRSLSSITPGKFCVVRI